VSCCHPATRGGAVSRAEEPNVFDAILSPMSGPLRQAADSLEDDATTYVLSFVPFTVNMIFGIINSIKSVSQLVTQIKTSETARRLGLVVSSKTGYHEAFHRYTAEQYREIFIGLLKSLPLLEIPELASLGLIYLVDGSVFPAISSMEWACYKNQANAIKLHLCFELNRMVPVQFLSSHAKSSEKKFLESILEKHVTYICDRGYVSFVLFYQICHKGAAFVIRGKNNMRFAVVEPLAVAIPDRFVAWFATLSDVKAIFDNDPHKAEYRIVSFTVAGEFYLLITSRFDLTTYQVIMLYAYRWQVELIFRLLKRTLKGIHLMVHHPKGVEIQFYLYMITYLLLLSFKQKCTLAKTSDHPIAKNMAQDEQAAERPDDNARLNTKASGRQYVCGLVSMLGERLRDYWKLGLHWLINVRNSLFRPARLEIPLL
jgi:hypothetical protein